MAVSSRTTYYNPDRSLVLDYALVKQHYLRTWFVPDLVANIPYEVFFLLAGVDATQAGALGLAKMPRLLRPGRRVARAQGATSAGADWDCPPVRRPKAGTGD
jgi:hypothetical protein